MYDLIDEGFVTLQIMVLLTSALRAERPSELRAQALEAWYVLVWALAHSAPQQLAGVMNQVCLRTPPHLLRCLHCYGR